MKVSYNLSTVFRWKIDNFGPKRTNSWLYKVDLTSEEFSLSPYPSAQFGLIVDSRKLVPNKKSFAVVLKQLFDGKPVEVKAKLWFEDKNGQKFGKNKVEKHIFSQVGDRFAIDILTFDDHNLFNKIYNSKEPLFVCCKLIDLNASAAPIDNFDQESRQNLWALYEQNVYDTIIKTNNKEFKVFKNIFMIHSEVFKRMFLSNFNESANNFVEIKDVDEETMNHFIKWLYTGCIDEDSPIEELYKVADKYDVKNLKAVCIQRMISTFDSKNVFLRLVLAILYNEGDLKEAALTNIASLPAIDHTNFFSSSIWNHLYNKHAEIATEVSDLIKKKLNE